MWGFETHLQLGLIGLCIGRSTQLELCLLYYFAGHHEDAWEELQMLQGEQGSADEAIPQETLLPLFRQKLKLCRSMEAIDA